MSRDIAIAFLSTVSQGMIAFLGLILVAYVYIDEQLRSGPDDTAQIRRIRRNRAFSRFRPLLYLEGLVIVGSLLLLLVLPITPYISRLETWLLCGLAAGHLVILLLMLWTLNSFLDPALVTHLSREAMERASSQLSGAGGPQASGEFVAQYDLLSQMLKSSVERLGYETRGLGFESMIGILLASKQIDVTTDARLRIVHTTRNLIVHGDLENVDQRIVRLASECVTLLEGRLERRG